MKPFDLEKAKAGAPVQTRDGRPARIVSFDNSKPYPILAIIPNAADGEETPYNYTNFGMCNPYFKSKVDLFMASAERTTAQITWEE